MLQQNIFKFFKCETGQPHTHTHTNKLILLIGDT